MKTPKLNNYLNLLNDVYNYGSITTQLCRKHRISNRTTKTLKELHYADLYGKSTMKRRPTLDDAKKIIAQNRKKNAVYNQRPIQKQIKFKEKNTPVKIEPKSNTTEINLFWGMIKIIK